MANAGVRGRPIAPLVLSAQERAYSVGAGRFPLAHTRTRAREK